MHRPTTQTHAFSLLELLAVLTMIAILIGVIITRASNGQASSKSAACQTNKGNIEVQVELWLNNTGSLPATNLSNIGADVNYFPSGLPVCPVNGSAYTIDSSGRVVGHNH